MYIGSNSVWAQFKACGVEDQSIESIRKREARILEIKKGWSRYNLQTQNTVQYLPIKPHILRTSANGGGISLAQLNAVIVQLNKYFLSLNSGVQFYICGQPNYIANDQFYYFDASEEGTLCNNNDVSDAINIYFPGTIHFGGTEVAGYSYFPSTLSESNRVFVKVDAVSDNRSLLHEMGHYFNLLHTFQNSTTYPVTNREYVNGSNCSTRGDLVCDTPADPFGRDSVALSGCNYTGTALDPNGQLYQPALNNMMSYFPAACGNEFTAGQYSRMANGVLLRTDSNNEYILNCPSTVVGSAVPSNVTLAMATGGVTITFTDNSSNESGFIIERSTTSSSSGFVPIAGLSANTTSYTDQTTTSFTTYFYRVKASNSSNEYSPAASITTAYSYCTPLYSNSCNSIGMIIDDFILKKTSDNTLIINNIDSNCSPSNYGDYTATPYTVEAGTTYTITARAVSNSMGSFFPQHVSIWVDYDKNGVFDVSERVFASSGSTQMAPSVSTNITIPTYANGLTRMRIRSRYASLGQPLDPCIAYEFGEAEDYMLNVSSANIPDIDVLSVTPNPVCAGSNITVQFVPINFTSNSYTVQLSDKWGNNFQNIPTTITSNGLLATIPSNTQTEFTYKIRVVSSSPTVISDTISNFTVYSIPAAPTVQSPVNYTLNQSTIPLQATGQNLLWYTSINGTGSSTPITPSTSQEGTTLYYVSQTVNGCTSPKSTIQVIVTAPILSMQIISVAPSVVCAGQQMLVQVQMNNFTSTSLVVQLSDNTGYNYQSVQTINTSNGLVAYLPNTLSYSNTYRLRVVSTTPAIVSDSSGYFTINAIPSPPTVVSPVIYELNDTPTPLEAIGNELLWYESINGNGSPFPIVPTTNVVGTKQYFVTQTINNCESSKATIEVVVNNPSAAGVCLDIKVLLEGPLQSNNSMTTLLNQKQLLPGQTLNNTSNRQPYLGAPWYYGGTESVTTYDADIVDWVMVSLRTQVADSTTEVFKTAALLKSNGKIKLVANCPNIFTTNSYYIFVEHRNHIGAASHVPVAVVNDTLKYDFSLQQSYIPSGVGASGQRKKGTVYCLIAGDGHKRKFPEVNANDSIIWRQNNGKVFKYLLSDYDLDGEVNANDSIIWRRNNGTFSVVIF